MDQITVCILNYKRPDNIQHHILPSLLSDSRVSLVIIAHGNSETVFGLDRVLKDDEQVLMGKVLHVTNFKENDMYRCFRRWRLIRKLYKEGIIKTDTILVQDDDIMFHPNEIHKLHDCLKEKKGVFIGGSYGRNIEDNKYVFKAIAGPCDIVIGQSICGYVKDICRAVENIEKSKIPTDLIMYEDDITVCYFVLQDKQIKNKQHFAMPLKCTDLPDNDAVCKRLNHHEKRNKTLSYLIHLPTA